MAATGTPTPNLGLRIPLGTDPASVDDINYNSNALDTVIGDVGETSVAGQLSATNNRISAVQDGLAIVCNGNTHAAIEAGQFAYVKNHGTLAEGLYRNNTGSTIAANATLSSSNLTADTSGGLNTVYDALNSNLTAKTGERQYNNSASGLSKKDFATVFLGNIYDDTTIPIGVYVPIRKIYTGVDEFVGIGIKVTSTMAKMTVWDSSRGMINGTKNGNNVYIAEFTGTNL